MSHSQTSGWRRVPRVSGSGCPRVPVNLGWDGRPGERESRETGVGKNEHSPADMRRTKVASRKLNSGCVEASSRQIARDFGFPFLVAGRLLHDKPFDIHVDADPQHVRPEGFAGSLPVDSGSDACTLARRAADDEIGSAVRFERLHVVVYWDTRELMRDESTPAWLDLAELHGSEVACIGEPEGVSAKATEEIDDIHRPPSFVGGVTPIASVQSFKAASNSSWKESPQQWRS